MLRNWQEVLDLLAIIVKIPAALIMKVEPPHIKVCLSSHSHGNPYEEHEMAALGTGLYCETVMATRAPLLVPDALADPHWRNNPDVKLGMISHLGLPLVWPDQNIFGTICVLDGRENHYSPPFLQLIQQFRGIVERVLKQIYYDEVRVHEEAAIRADDAKRVRLEFAAIRDREQKALQAIKESKQRWHFALEGAGDGVWDWDMARNTVFYSKRCLELPGFPEHKSLVDFAEWERCPHPDDAATVLAEVQACLDGCIPAFANEHRVQAGGGWKWLLTRGMVVGRDDAGRPLRMTGTYSDPQAGRSRLAGTERPPGRTGRHADGGIAARHGTDRRHGKDGLAGPPGGRCGPRIEHAGGQYHPVIVEPEGSHRGYLRARRRQAADGQRAGRIPAQRQGRL
ncbi:MAG TPA: hypothetical protein DCW29_21515 [Janthinobacterium sp.]|nr:hypothetical protein [Janthinobacterium sp.]